jgi:hypothetical protein
MPSLFKELEILDRPFIPITSQIGNRNLDIEVRLPSAQEQDCIDSYYMDQYAKVLADKLEVKPGRKTSERDSLRVIYEGRPKTDLIEQIVPTRQSDIEVRAYEIAGLDRETELKKLLDLNRESPEKAAERAKELDDILTDGRIQARNEMVALYEEKSVEELAQLMSDININIKSTQAAGQAREADVLYYSMFLNGERLFESPEEILEELRPEKISEITKAIREAISRYEDLPFVSPVANAPNGVPSSLGDSVAVTKVGGRPIPQVPANSKQSSSRVSTKRRKNTSAH